MHREPIISSHIQSAGYDRASGVMEVEFQGRGRVVRYEGVTPEEWAGFQDAPSKGKFLHQNIKAHAFEYVEA
jgi:hypothetical protein